MDTWPTSNNLPQSVREDYEMQPRTGLLDFDERRCPVRNRTYPEWSAMFSMYVSDIELATFRTFYDNTIKQSGPFIVPWLDALGFGFYFVQFTEEGPSWSQSDIEGLWLLKLPLDVIMLAETDSSGYVDYYPPEESS
jgi:hypothetical protein